MDFVYTPEGRENNPYRWEWAPGKIPSPDAELIERRSGMLFPDWSKACANGSIRAQHAFLYVMLRKDNPDLAWDQVVFTADEISLEYTEADERQWLENLEAAEARGETLTEAERGLLEALRKAAAENAPAEAETPVEGGAPVDPTPPPGKPGKKPKRQPSPGDD